MFRFRRPHLTHIFRRIDAPRPRRAFRPFLEALEDRTVPSYTVREFTLPFADAAPRWIAPGPDGNIWYSDLNRHSLGEISTTGQFVAEHPVDGASGPFSFTFDATGAFWTPGGHGGRYSIAYQAGYMWVASDNLTRTNAVTRHEDVFSLNGGVFGFSDLIAGPDGNIWANKVYPFGGIYGGSAIARIHPDGTSDVFDIHGSDHANYLPGGYDNNGQEGFAFGPDGNLWVPQVPDALGLPYNNNRLLQVNTQGQVIGEFYEPLLGRSPNHHMVAGPDGALWIAQQDINYIVRMTMDGSATAIPLPAGHSANHITVGPDGNIWFTEAGGNPPNDEDPFGDRPTNVIGEIVLNHPSTLSGLVYEDFNDDGQVDFGENGLSGASIRLQGTDVLGNSIDQTIPTDANGSYQFSDIFQGNYTITVAPPAGYYPGHNTIGTVNGVPTGSISGTDQFFVNLGDGVDGINYNFGERPVNGGTVHSGQTAGIGFWNNNHGQALIKALNGGQNATELGNWLAATFVNLFGANAGSNDLAGMTNAQVASAFQQKFMLHGPKLDAQVMATALSVYVTNNVLAGNVAAAYGFTVTHDGAGASTINIGSDGAAVGQANNTTMSIMDILLGVDTLSAGDNGILYGGNTTQRNAANDLFSRINQAGGI